MVDPEDMEDRLGKGVPDGVVGLRRRVRDC